MMGMGSGTGVQEPFYIYDGHQNVFVQQNSCIYLRLKNDILFYCQKPTSGTNHVFVLLMNWQTIYEMQQDLSHEGRKTSPPASPSHSPLCRSPKPSIGVTSAKKGPKPSMASHPQTKPIVFLRTYNQARGKTCRKIRPCLKITVFTSDPVQVPLHYTLLHYPAAHLYLIPSVTRVEALEAATRVMRYWHKYKKTRIIA